MVSVYTKISVFAHFTLNVHTLNLANISRGVHFILWIMANYLVFEQLGPGVKKLLQKKTQIPLTNARGVGMAQW